MKKIIGFMFVILLLAGCGVDKNASEGEDAENIETKEGVYVGQADTHTIEITVDNEPVSLDITDDSASDIENLKDGEKVTVKYQETEKGQLLLKDIEPTN
ncbi:hypothetical protein [Bacillus atrophaeus]|uniref:hypothetical protein n=1 Tax=Bacillus atrophaeus TaxID=1452 RepID=UPI00240D1DFD|nr:hypothetical protein [Bacillus atrophaeus]